MRRAGKGHRLKVRIMSYGMGLDSAKAISPKGPSPWFFSDRLKMEAVKFFDDGALGVARRMAQQTLRRQAGHVRSAFSHRRGISRHGERCCRARGIRLRRMQSEMPPMPKSSTLTSPWEP